MRRLTLLAAGIALTALGFGISTAGLAEDDAEPPSAGAFIPVGAGYSDTHPGLIERVSANDTDGELRILVIASAFSYDAEAISDDDRALNTEDAEARRAELEELCLTYVEDQTCIVTLAPWFIRADAEAPEALDLITPGLDAVYFLGGDQAVAMRVLAGTPVEDALRAAHEAGTIIAGTSAGNAVQSRAMIAGYVGDFGPETGLREGAVEVWAGDADSVERGLDFGLEGVILDQHFFQRARLGRLVNVITQPGAPRIGIGVDAYTGLVIRDRAEAGDLFGLYTAAALDAASFGAAENARYVAGVLSARNIAMHLLAPGGSAYDLTTRTHSLAPLPESIAREWALPRLPEGVETLILSGNLRDLDDVVVDTGPLARLAELSGGAAASVLIVPLGYPDEAAASAAVEEYGAALGVPFTTDSEADYTGALLIGADKTLIDPRVMNTQLEALVAAGVPIMAEGAPAALFSAFYATHGPTPESTDDDPFAEEDAVQGSFIRGNTFLAEGFWWVNATIESNLLIDLRLGRWITLAYANPYVPSIGLSDGAAIEVTADGVTVLGNNGLFVLDLGLAEFDLGSNDALVFANGLLDVFAPGESLVPATP